MIDARRTLASALPGLVVAVGVGGCGAAVPQNAAASRVLEPAPVPVRDRSYVVAASPAGEFVKAFGRLAMAGLGAAAKIDFHPQ